MTCMIIEDDPFMIIEYEMLLKKMDIEVVSVSKNLKHASGFLKKNLPDFAILDLHLANNDRGLDFAMKLKNACIPYIVITGFPKEMVYNKLRELDAEAFLVKPINRLSLEFEIDKLRTRIKKFEGDNEFFYIKERSTFIKLPFKDVYYFTIDGNYTSFHTKHKRYIIKKSLSKVYDSINKKSFIRIHRSSVVNKNAIAKVDLKNSQIYLSCNRTLDLGNKYTRDLKEFLNDNSIQFE